MPLDHHSLSLARLAANRANAQLSTGPITPAGKATVSQNRCRHGLTGTFMVLPWEREEDFKQLAADLRSEHQPSTPTEKLLVDRMAQHYWLMQRAISLQNFSFNLEAPDCDSQRDLALYLRYQTTHERAFHKCLRELATLRAERRKSDLGFESQKRAQAAEERKNFAESRKQAAEIRHQELHTARLNLFEMKIAAQKPRLTTPNLTPAPDLELQQAA